MAFPTNPTDGQIYKNKKYNSGKGVWEDSFIPPIGFIYTQLPGQSEPATLYGGTWSNISSTYAGNFFRAEGGNALAFNGGQQGDAIRNISGWGGSTINYGTSGALYYPNGTNRQSVGPGSWALGDIYLDASRIVPTANENRPINQTIRIWKRIA